jgi:hypothetical protein
MEKLEHDGQARRAFIYLIRTRTSFHLLIYPFIHSHETIQLVCNKYLCAKRILVATETLWVSLLICPARVLLIALSAATLTSFPRRPTVNFTDECQSHCPSTPPRKFLTLENLFQQP